MTHIEFLLWTNVLPCDVMLATARFTTVTKAHHTHEIVAGTPSPFFHFVTRDVAYGRKRFLDAINGHSHRERQRSSIAFCRHPFWALSVLLTSTHFLIGAHCIAQTRGRCIFEEKAHAAYGGCQGVREGLHDVEDLDTEEALSRPQCSCGEWRCTCSHVTMYM